MVLFSTTVIEYKGTSKSVEGFTASITFRRAKEEGMQIAIDWQDADFSSTNEVFPDADITICGGHAGHAHTKNVKTTPEKEKGI